MADVRSILSLVYVRWRHSFVGDIQSCTTVFSVIVFVFKQLKCVTAHHLIMCSLYTSILKQLSASGFGSVCHGMASKVLRYDAVRFYSSGTPEGSCICTVSAHSSPVADLN